jgi:hypothetical protein
VKYNIAQRASSFLGLCNRTNPRREIAKIVEKAALEDAWIDEMKERLASGYRGWDVARCFHDHSLRL